MTKWLVVGKDQRLKMANDILLEQNYSSRYVAADAFNEELKQVLTEWQPDQIILPLLPMKDPIPPELLGPSMKVFTGQASQEWLNQLDEKKVRHANYLHYEPFIWQNARLTAEAFVQVFYEQTKRQIAGKHFYVAGFGRVGKAVAQVLRNLQATVTIAARSDEQLAEAAIAGYEPLRLTERTVFSNDYLVNTIPSQWLDPEKSGETRIFDLASAPGCLKPSYSSEYYTIHLKLPGIHFPVDAAAALVEAILRMDIEERGVTCLKENESD
ncbi:NAD(P)-dependent oxidoreductase [Sporosarcina aquimarina]|uniref:NAD(P)-dependent oxidoreductase n=1 Tax=Sporosarcina aquimarina TaxID=114975 RepID=UPI001C8D28AC|nr:NAD(P)-dependent oxidoreductase [Sporosarcina aquimarina]MBY0222010.1 dipicolinate synthase subunit A [Sporosarcina aquimarina]